MKRSEINNIIKSAKAFIAASGYILPPFAHFTPEEMRAPIARSLRERSLGWDVTDYGQGRFRELGLCLFTVRNGLERDLSQGRGMLYAEKIMVSQPEQLTPMHRHIVKAEDIINRGGGDLIIEVYASETGGAISRKSPVELPCDGILTTLPPGGHLRLRPGQSVTLLPGVWHAFWAEKGSCLIGEVSTVNNDRTDNVFEMKLSRFGQINEDDAPTHLLVSDY